jgi:hypothetical protein
MSVVKIIDKIEETKYLAEEYKQLIASYGVQTLIKNTELPPIEQWHITDSNERSLVMNYLNIQGVFDLKLSKLESYESISIFLLGSVPIAFICTFFNKFDEKIEASALYLILAFVALSLLLEFFRADLYPIRFQSRGEKLVCKYLPLVLADIDYSNQLKQSKKELKKIRKVQKKLKASD